MKVEIWSDVMCPFCYIGKRRFEKALEQFPGRDDIELVWKSFQLNPAMKTEPGKNINQYLSEVKGWSLIQAKQANDYVTSMAKEMGLNYDFDKAVVANSFDAHRLLQLAKVNGKGDAMEEQLFNAYFTEGKNIADHDTLIQLATTIGLEHDEVKKVLNSNDYTEAVERDIYEARQIGVRGVPYFVLNDRYAVSGAQATETFLGALNKAWGEWEKERPALQNLNTSTEVICATDGDCK
ncbi:MAG: DsbA family oxidoreductase [Chitinophagaceae bacterium]